jgi:hypothetical protein
MKAINTLTAVQLAKTLCKAQDKAASICERFIAAGRGHETPSIMRTQSDPLSLEWRASADILAELQFEQEYRMSYHGSLKPVK